jgi:hypothetical protein
MVVFHVFACHLGIFHVVGGIVFDLCNYVNFNNGAH